MLVSATTLEGCNLSFRSQIWSSSQTQGPSIDEEVMFRKDSEMFLEVCKISIAPIIPQRER